ncbi:MAG: flagellar biosynthesis protein FlhA, partial [Lachnospiraceae bacterium]|nr:flagellar biosynthesis protein FlhA [Lachnospiraceae bacterium]
MRIGDVGVTLYLLAAFIMLIVPIRSGLLDVLLACNIAVAFTIMFGCMFANEVLQMSFYPTILLFTTVFRIALNVSSTRLILSEGDAGNVVQTFGQYVGGGD